MTPERLNYLNEYLRNIILKLLKNPRWPPYFLLSQYYFLENQIFVTKMCVKHKKSEIMAMISEIEILAADRLNCQPYYENQYQIKNNTISEHHIKLQVASLDFQ